MEETLFKDSFVTGLIAGLINNNGRDVSEWAETVRYLPAEGSPEPGKWRNARTPYAVEIMRELSIFSDTEKVAFMKGTQVCGTEIILNFHGYVMNWQPQTMMVMMPTVEVCRKFSKQRLQTMIECTPELRAIIDDSRSQDSGNTILTKQYQGGFMFLVGSNSSIAARSTPAGYVTADEIDEYPSDMGGDGDWLALIDKRMSNFRNSKILLVSTPTVKDISRIEYEFNRGDKNYYYVPCPKCNIKQIIQWDNFVYDEKDIKSIRLKCIACEHLIKEADKEYMFKNGEWRPSCIPKQEKTKSYHLSSLYSAYGWRTWAKCLGEFLEAKESPIKMKTFTNTVLGETFEETAREVNWEITKGRAEPYECQVPRGVIVLTAGADVQPDRIEIEVVGWGLGEESWHIEHHVFYGDPARQSIWTELDMFLKRTFQGVDGITFRILAACVDTAGGHEKQAYEFIRTRERYRIFGIKGASRHSVPLINRPSKKSKVKKISLITIGTYAAKTTIYSYLNVENVGPCFCHFPEGLPDEYYLQLTAEKIRIKYKNGFPYGEFHKIRQRNEIIDCRVYALAALTLLNPSFVILYEQIYKSPTDKNKKKTPKIQKSKRSTGKFKRST